jgi:hypothetical protein
MRCSRGDWLAAAAADGGRYAALIADHGLKYRLPVMVLFPTMVERRALIFYGPDLIELFLRAAAYVDKIPRGASPARLPIEQPSTFALVINLKTAKALGITVPSSLLPRGVSMIRSVPNSCTRPVSVLNGWPASATSSPMRNTRGSRRISSAIAPRTASP